jgi:hypothetical protein
MKELERHPRTIKGKEIWDQDEPAPEMVWAVCPWLLRGDETNCAHCPTWENDPDHGQVQRGCYGLAAEACRVVFAMQKRLKP